MKNNDKDSRMQVQKFYSDKTFVEVLVDALNIDKVTINFGVFDKNGAVGQRLTSSLKFYLHPNEAWALSQKIMNGQFLRARQKSADEATTAKSNFPKPIYSKMGGTPANKAKRPDGKSLSRTFSIAPGSKGPWVLTGESGPGVQDEKGLIVPDYGYGKPVSKPEQKIFLPLSFSDMEQFAGALNVAYQTWMMTRFVPLVQPRMDILNNEWLARQDSNYHAGVIDDEEEGSDSNSQFSGASACFED